MLSLSKIVLLFALMVATTTNTATLAMPTTPAPSMACVPGANAAGGQWRSRIVTWNVNGLKACINRMGLGSLKELLESFGEDVAVVCVQETKIHSQRDLDQSMCKPEGWDAFYTVSRKKQGKSDCLGYSGVATFCRQSMARPVDAQEGFTMRCSIDDVADLLPPEPAAQDGEAYVSPKWVQEAFGGQSWRQKICNTSTKELEGLDGEGRVLMTDHGDFCLFNCYFPATRMSGDEIDVDRLIFKLRFNYFFRQSAERLKCAGKRIVVVGDLNVALEKHDRADAPDNDEDFNSSPSRVWMRSLLENCSLVDLFRAHHPSRTESFTCWSMEYGQCPPTRPSVHPSIHPSIHPSMQFYPVRFRASSWIAMIFIPLSSLGFRVHSPVIMIFIPLSHTIDSPRMARAQKGLQT